MKVFKTILVIVVLMVTVLCYGEDESLKDSVYITCVGANLTGLFSPKVFFIKEQMAFIDLVHIQSVGDYDIYNSKDGRAVFTVYKADPNKYVIFISGTAIMPDGSPIIWEGEK